MTPLQNTQQESRRFQRFSVLSDVKVYFQLEGQHRPLNARLIDISYPFMGLKVVGNYGISEQSAITLKLVSDQEELIILCRGVVGWCHESILGETPDESVYHIGIFVGEDSKEAQHALDTQILRLIPVRLSDLYTRLKNQSTYGYVPNYAKVFGHRPEVMVRWGRLLAEIRRPMDDRLFELATFAAAYELRNTACSLAHGQQLAKFINEESVQALAKGEFSDDITEAA